MPRMARSSHQEFLLCSRQQEITFFPMNLPSHQASGRSTNEAFPSSPSAMGKT
jgi:hypothetical protein